MWYFYEFFMGNGNALDIGNWMLWKVWESFFISVKFRVVSYLDLHWSVTQTESLWELCPKLHDVWKRDLAKKKGRESVLERAEMQMVIGGCVVPLWERSKKMGSWDTGWCSEEKQVDVVCSCGEGRKGGLGEEIKVKDARLSHCNDDAREIWASPSHSVALFGWLYEDKLLWMSQSQQICTKKYQFMLAFKETVIVLKFLKFSDYSEFSKKYLTLHTDPFGFLFHVNFCPPIRTI